MNTLSVLLPVYNANGNLEPGVTEILDVLSELSRRFELCILDDGSTDDTADTARELAARYPQIRVIRHPVRLGLSEAIQTGLDHTDGEVILVGDEDYCLEPDDLRTLWQLRDTQWRMTRQSTLIKGANEPWMDKLLAWKPRSVDSRRGFQIIMRQAFEQFRMQQSLDSMRRLDGGKRPVAAKPSERPNFLNRSRHFALEE